LYPSRFVLSELYSLTTTTDAKLRSARALKLS